MTPTEPNSIKSSSAASRHFRWKRWISIFAIALLFVLISGELFARFYLGLGDPPLSVADPEMEYRFKPSMHYRRFGNSVTYNQYSMRSGPVTPKKTDPNELRVMFVGDSIINGGSPTDDSRLATALLQSRLQDALSKPVYVGNISAGSWGPPNELAYLKRYGFFEADLLVLVFNSEDYCDVPTFEPIVGVSQEFPDHAPVLALQEAVSRYLLPRLRAQSVASSAPPAAPTTQSVDQCMDAIRQIVQLGKAAGVKDILIVQYPSSQELISSESPGHAKIAATARELGIEPIQLTPAFAASLRAGQQPYRDVLHPNDLGQKLISDVLFDRLREKLAK